MRETGVSLSISGGFSLNFLSSGVFLPIFGFVVVFFGAESVVSELVVGYWPIVVDIVVFFILFVVI